MGLTPERARNLTVGTELVYVPSGQRASFVNVGPDRLPSKVYGATAWIYVQFLGASNDFAFAYPCQDFEEVSSS